MLLRHLPERWKNLIRRRAGAITVSDRLRNLVRAGFRPQRIIDAGAYRGDWTRMAHGIFRGASFLMIEPQPDMAERLKGLSSTLPRVQFRPALLAAQPGRARFVLSHSNSRIIGADVFLAGGEQTIHLDATTLAQVAAEEGYARSDLIKLDLQGHELEALQGAGDLFGQTEVIIAETTWLRIGEAPLVHEVWAAFQTRGYRLYDIFEFNHRPFDGALWQADVVFVRADSALLASSRWQ